MKLKKAFNTEDTETTESRGEEKRERRKKKAKKEESEERIARRRIARRRIARRKKKAERREEHELYGGEGESEGGSGSGEGDGPRSGACDRSAERYGDAADGGDAASDGGGRGRGRCVWRRPDGQPAGKARGGDVRQRSSAIRAHGLHGEPHRHQGVDASWQ